jgi:4-amino-4-deoxy-L-arabinose transferase-like glycosyltransferase
MLTIKSPCAPLVILALFLSLGLCYSYYTPLWNPPDEERHFAYCEYVAQHHALPPYRPDPEGNIVSMAYHPPLYYLIGSLFFRNDQGLLEEEILINDGPGYNLITHPEGEAGSPYAGKVKTAHLLRLFSLLLSGITVYLIYLIAQTIFPGDTIFASAVSLFVATIPEFLYISAAVSNDSLSITISTALLLSLLCYLKNPQRLTWQVASGVFLGASLLSKTFTIIYLPVTVCFVIWVCVREKKNSFQPLFVMLALAMLVSGWWYLRNWLLFNDPMLSKTVEILNPWHPRRIPFSLSYATTVAQKTFASFFGAFGAFQFTIPNHHFATYGGILLLGIAGGLRSLSAQRGTTLFPSRALGLLSLSLLGGAGFYAYINFQYVGMFLGRYLFIVLAPIATITLLGVQALFPLRWRSSVFLLLSLLLIAQNVNVIFRVLKPSYADTLLAEGVNQPMFCCPTPVISGNTTVSQMFIAPRNNLSAIRVMFSCMAKQLSGDITFALEEVGVKGKTLHRMRYPLEEINDSDRCCFIFPPIHNSMGREYLFTFSSPSLPLGKGISLWYNRNKSGAEGRMLINGTPAPGNLYFQAYCFAGEHPETDWQGRREAVINQGWYLGIRELQLYYERTRGFREKTLTHKKFQMIGKALINRSASPR